MFFSPFLALRYLQPKRTFVSVITFISILGVALGVWLLTVVIAVFTGYGEVIKNNILGFEPHLVVGSEGYMEDIGAILDKVDGVEGIESASPVVMGPVMMEYKGRINSVLVRGILQPDGENLKRLEGKIARSPIRKGPGKTVPWGEFDISDPYSVVIGRGIARSNKLTVGDKILLHSVKDLEPFIEALIKAEKKGNADALKKIINSLQERTAPQELMVKGVFDSGNGDIDNGVIFCHLETAQILYGFDLDQAHAINIQTVDGLNASFYQKKLKKTLGEKFKILTWMQRHQSMFNAIAAERQAMYLILFMIMVVSAFTITNTMITVTYQKRTEIGLLKALGAQEKQIAWVFLFQGVFVGLLGVIIGLCMAGFTIYFRNEMAGWAGRTFGVDLFSQELFRIDGGLPAKQSFRDMAIISTGSFIACALAALIPALIAATLQPAKALRDS